MIRNRKVKIACGIVVLCSAAIAVAAHYSSPASHVDSALLSDDTYLSAQDAVAHMQDTPNCATLAQTMMAYASDLTMPQRSREIAAYTVMKKATQYCM
jgi:hypothetical protein